MKRFLAGMLTALVAAAIFWSAGSRRSDAPAGPASERQDAATISPLEDADPARAAVQSLIDAAARGDVIAYLDAFTGDLRRRLEREMQERGREAFSGDLRKTADSRKSHAVFEAEAESSETTRVVVESVYLDRNERQTYQLAKKGAAWLVTGVESVKTRQPKAKFGQPASYIAPEGVPVQPGVAVETGEEPIDTTPQESKE
jgi:hypothetical protein